MSKNLRLGALTALFVGLAALAGMGTRPRIQPQPDVITIAEARWEHAQPSRVPVSRKKAFKITTIRHDNSTLVDYIAPYRDCSVPAADNAIANDPRCEGLSLSENEPLETNPH